MIACMKQPPPNSDVIIARLHGFERITAFDTNAYRGLVSSRPPSAAHNRADRLAQAEQKRSIVVFAIPWVIIELIPPSYVDRGRGS